MTHPHLSVSRFAHAPADRVTITKAKWKARLLTIEATSTNPKAILSVFSQSGGFMFELTNSGGGRYSDQRGFIFSPEVITVRSNLGGSATATVTNYSTWRTMKDPRVLYLRYAVRK